MGILSSNLSITQYRVKGQISEAIMETVLKGLKTNTVVDIDQEPVDHSIGWTPFENPYQPDFELFSYIFGPYFIFSLRVDKKSIPAKIIKKHCHMEMTKRLKETGREYLSRNEKKTIKENVVLALCQRMPATPNIYDVIWEYEQSKLWFFSNLKSANEALETLFYKSFQLSLIRVFPYTSAHFFYESSPKKQDRLAGLVPTRFVE